MSLPREFASDNTAPVHPAVLAALGEANAGPAYAYGDDAWTARAQDWFRAQFGDDVTTAFVWNGTGANVVSLRLLTRPFHAVLCARQAHINVDECGAPEFLAGCKLVDLDTPDAKLTPAIVRAAVRGVGNEHAVQPRVVSISQTTEYGTCYTVEELRALTTTAHDLGLLVHMDGARIANAAAALDVPLRAVTRDAGVDVLSFGGTKNGGMGAEAVVVFEPSRAEELKFLRKQTAQLASKMRFLAAQFLALAEEDRWLHNARHANAMARRLAEAITPLPGVRLTQRVEANAVFAILPEGVAERLQREFHFYTWDETTGEVRLMTSWATAPDDVDQFTAAIASAIR